jgi:hypothetical protein
VSRDLAVGLEVPVVARERITVLLAVIDTRSMWAFAGYDGFQDQSKASDRQQPRDSQPADTCQRLRDSRGVGTSTVTTDDVRCRRLALGLSQIKLAETRQPRRGNRQPAVRLPKSTPAVR